MLLIKSRILCKLFSLGKKKKRNIVLAKFPKSRRGPRIYRPLLTDMVKYLLRVS